MEIISILILTLAALLFLGLIICVILIIREERKLNIKNQKLINIHFNGLILDVVKMNDGTNRYTPALRSDETNGFVVEINRFDNNIFRLKSVRIMREDPDNDCCYLDDNGHFSSGIEDDKIWFRNKQYNYSCNRLVSVSSGKILTPSLKFVKDEGQEFYMRISRPTPKRESIEFELDIDEIVDSEFSVFIRLKDKQLTDDHVEILYNNTNWVITSMEQSKFGILINGKVNNSFIRGFSQPITIKAVTKPLKYIYIN